MIELSAPSLWDLLKHAALWLRNLSRAGEARKTESRAAVRQIITAAQETSVYVRRLNETGRPSHSAEAKISRLWTELSFQLEDLGIEKLAKRCRIKGKYWSDPSHYDSEFLEKADISLDRMEKLSKEILADIGH